MKLSELYDRVTAASARGDADAAQKAFMAAVGLEVRRPATEVPTRLPPRTAPMLRYLEPRAVDRYALLFGARNVAKFEDLTESKARELEADFRSRGLRTVRTGPYRKRFDVAISSDDAGELYNVIASRGTQAEKVAEAEQDRTPSGTRAAGLALGYPPCCVEHFVAIERSPLAEREGINETAIRSPQGQGGDAPWEMNLLSTMSPVGFVPCAMTCPRALAFARAVLDAVERANPKDYATLRTVLSRPILFFRYSTFFVLVGVATTRGDVRSVRYAAAIANDDGTGRPDTLSAWQYAELGSILDAGNEVTLGDGALTIRRDDSVLASFRVADARVPMLLRFTSRT